MNDLQTPIDPSSIGPDGLPKKNTNLELDR